MIKSLYFLQYLITFCPHFKFGLCCWWKWNCNIGWNL